MDFLSRESILSASDLPFEDVEVPEWGGMVRIRTMTGTERDAFEQEMVKDGRMSFANVRARLVGRCAILPTGERLFSDDDIQALGAKSAAGLDRVFGVAQRLNGLTKEDVESLGKD